MQNTNERSEFHLAFHKHSFYVFPTHMYDSPVFKIEWVQTYAQIRAIIKIRFNIRHGSQAIKFAAVGV